MDELQTARTGAGRLLQRDYWAIIRNCRIGPRQVAEFVALRFPEFAPPELVTFERVGPSDRPLEVGDEMRVTIRMTGTFGVRIIHRNANSLTIGTLERHPEAGRITFGAYRSDRGDVIFHIRSRSRASNPAMYAGFLAGGEAMQSNCWVDFVDAVAHSTGDGVIGFVHCETTTMAQDEPEESVIRSPTYLAEGA